MAEKKSGCIWAVVAFALLGIAFVVTVAVGVAAWYLWSNRVEAPAVTGSGPWTLTVDNPTDVAVAVGCALESAPPSDIPAHGSGTLTITTLPATCTGKVGDVVVLEFAAGAPPDDGVGWTATAHVAPAPVDVPPEAAPAGVPPADATTPATPSPAAPPAAEPKAAPPPSPSSSSASSGTSSSGGSTAKKSTKATSPTPSGATTTSSSGSSSISTTPAAESPASAPAPAASGPTVLKFAWPGGPKFADIEVSVDGVSKGHPTSLKLPAGQHSVQLFKDGVMNVSCSIDLPAEGMTFSVSRKGTCPN